MSAKSNGVTRGKSILLKVAEPLQKGGKNGNTIEKNKRKKVNRTDLKIHSATKGLTNSYYTRIDVLSSRRQAYTICDYIIALEIEMRMSDRYRESILNTLITLARSLPKKAFKDFTRTDVVAYMNRFKKGNSEDPTHRWINTYNFNLVNVIKFFRWLYSPDIGPKERPKPAVVQNLPSLRRKETSIYEPSDMWDAEDNRIFLRYCPSARDSCYHAIEADAGMRPHELLNLKIKDVEFKEDGGSKYARILVNGKTGQRSLVLIDSIPYVIQWISNHPQGNNREAILLPNMQTGKAIRVNAMFKAYKNHKEYFTSLLSQNIPEDDKKKIGDLLKKRWNPYVHRHSSITEKLGILKSEAKLRMFAGWTPRSNMHYKYVHLRGNEAGDDLLRAKGIIKDDKEYINILSPKICPNPNCKEPNKPDAQFCYKCNFIMSFEAYQKDKEERQRKDQEIQGLRKQTQILNEQLAAVIEQQQQHANSFDRKFEELLKIVNTRFHQDDATAVISGQISKMMPRKLTTKELQKIESRRNLTGVFIDSMPD
jgi:integrase